MVQWVGYVGSALVAMSLMMNNIWRLRWINLVGASTFAAYGLLIQAWPVVVLNSFIAAVDIVYLILLSRKKDIFSFFEVTSDSAFLKEFLAFWSDDIARFFPEFSLEELKNPEIRLNLRNMVPVGVFVCEDGGDGVAEVRLDYVVPDYRDFKNARFVYSSSHARLRACGFRSFTAESGVPAHQRFLRKVGFREDPAQSGRFTLPV